MVAVVRRLRGAFRRADGGFSMVEVIVAMGLLLIVLSAASMLFFRSMQTTRVQQQRQEATALADQALEVARSVKPTSLLDGWSQTVINNQWTNPGVNLSQTAKPTATNPGNTQLITPTTNPVVAGTTYTVKTYIGDCWTPKVASVACTATNVSTYLHMYRVAVSVTWRTAQVNSCPATNNVCAVTADTLIDPSADPTFNSNG